jgi:hypothetical protein
MERGVAFMEKGKSFFFILIFFILLGIPVAAQEEEEPGEIPIDSDWSDFMPALYARGDQTFIISLGPIIPTLFYGESGLVDNNVKVGGTGSLAYNFFLSSHFFIGGELGGMFTPTLGENTLFMVPFGFRVGYQWVFKRFEFPLTLMVGAVPQRYLNYGYFGLIIKPIASIFFRYNSDWSFGLNAAWWWTPEWTKGRDIYGNFVDVTISARYHF